jgi:LSD1 subclass zinc finger protein
MADLKALKCPSCGGPLDMPSGGARSIRCPYCGTTLHVGDELRDKPQAAVFSHLNTQVQSIRKLGELVRSGKKIEAIKVYREAFGVSLQEAKEAVDHLAAGEPVQAGNVRIETQSSSSEYQSIFDPEAAAALAGIGSVAATTSSIGCGLVSGMIALVIVVGVGLAAFLFVAPSDEMAGLLDQFGMGGIVEVVEPGGVLDQYGLGGIVEVVEPEATVVRRLGGEGLGSGLFQDARYIGLDEDGNIYVGDFETGLVTRFEADGSFSNQWQSVPAGETGYLLGMAVSREGHVYTAVSVYLFEYDGETGALLGQYDYADAFTYSDLAVTVEGSLLATYSRGPVDNLVRFDSAGNGTLISEGVINSLTGDAETIPLVAVDGLGNIYVLGRLNSTVVRLSPSGQLQTRFGGDGDGEGQFRAPQSITVDGQGNIYVSDIFGVQVFDNNGRYLRTLNIQGPVRDMTFGPEGDLYMVTLDQVVIQYHLKEH